MRSSLDLAGPSHSHFLRLPVASAVAVCPVLRTPPRARCRPLPAARFSRLHRAPSVAAVAAAPAGAPARAAAAQRPCSARAPPPHGRAHKFSLQTFSQTACLLRSCTLVQVHLLRLVFARCPRRCVRPVNVYRHPSTQPVGGAGGGFNTLSIMHVYPLCIRRLFRLQTGSDLRLRPARGKTAGRPRVSRSAVLRSSLGIRV